MRSIRCVPAVAMVVAAAVAPVRAQNDPALEVYNQALETCNELFRNDPAAYQVCLDQAAATKALMSGYGGGANAEELRNNALRVANEASAEAKSLLGDALQDVNCNELAQTLEDRTAYRLCADSKYGGGGTSTFGGGTVKDTVATGGRHTPDEQEVAAVGTFASESSGATSWPGLESKSANVAKGGSAGSKGAASGVRKAPGWPGKEKLLLGDAVKSAGVPWRRDVRSSCEIYRYKTGATALEDDEAYQECLEEVARIENSVSGMMDKGKEYVAVEAKGAMKSLAETAREKGAAITETASHLVDVAREKQAAVKKRIKEAGYKAYQALLGEDPPAVDYGNDLGFYPGDGKCDDGRFTGPGMGRTTEVKKDAWDCRKLHERGDIWLRPAFD